MAVGHKMCLQGLESGEQSAAPGNTHSALSRCKGKAPVVTDAMANGWGCGGVFSQVFGALVGGVYA